jgi:hypothetical protein
MTNLYGFDFLRSEHNTDDPTSVQSKEQISSSTGQPTDADASTLVDPLLPPTHEKTDLEKQFDVIQFLQNHRSAGCLPPSIIYKSVGVDLAEGGRDELVTKLLLLNARIRVEEIPDPENPSLTIYTFGYQAKFNNVRNRTGLIAQINRAKNGVRRRDLLDSYEGIQKDIDQLITSGDIIAVLNSEDKDKVLFPRGEPFLVELDGLVAPEDVDVEKLVEKYMPMFQQNGEQQGHDDVLHPQGKDNGNVQESADVVGSQENDDVMQGARRKAEMEKEQSLHFVKIDINPKRQIQRGEAIWIGGQWFRISSAVREGVPLSEQPTKAQAPLSVTSRKEMSKKNEVEGYIRDFDEHSIPLDHSLAEATLKRMQAAKDALEYLHSVAAQGRASTGKQKGVGAQLLSSNANAANPEALAAAFASTASSANFRRRPTGNRNSSAAHLDAKKSAEQIQAAKKAASDPNLLHSHARRHGCTLDVRDLYLATREEIQSPEKEVDIYNMMIKHKLLEPEEPMKRPRMSKKNTTLDENGKPKKRRYYERKGQRMTNTHLEGTEIGQALMAAAEKQSQGKSVGDGGM